MMNKPLKIFSNFVVAIFISLVLLSCKKLIEIPSNPSDKIPTDKAFSDSTNVLNVLSGIYNNFQIVDYGAAPSFYNGGVGIYTGLSGDELINRDVAMLPYQSPYYLNNLLPTDGYVAYMWTEAFKNIYTINISLSSIEKSDGLSESFKQKMRGELKFMRAWIYFHLLNMFGELPIVTSTDFKITAVLPREPVQEVNDFIISDLTEANTLLPVNYPSAGRARPNLFTVKAMLAKEYLFTENWQQAESLSTEVINSGMYSLENDVSNVFLKGSTEALWQYPSDGAGFSQTNDAYTFLPDLWIPDAVPRFEITPALLNAFEPDDSRRVNWINAQDVNGTIYNYPYKYKNGDPSIATTQEDYVFLRLAEQYLVRAEARTRLDMLEDGLEDLNVVRRRAGLPDKLLSDKQNLLNDILIERRVELFCEWGNRWFDVKRLNKADEIFGEKPNWEATDVLFPIPFSEIQRNPFLTQNAGY